MKVIQLGSFGKAAKKRIREEANLKPLEVNNKEENVTKVAETGQIVKEVKQ